MEEKRTDARIENKGTRVRVSNYVLYDDGAFVVLEAANGSWQLRWREDTMVGVFLRDVMPLAGNANVRDYLHCLFTVMYVSSSHAHDLVRLGTDDTMPFCEGVASLYDDEVAFEASVLRPATDGEDAEALGEVVTMREIEEELERLDKEGGDA